MHHWSISHGRLTNRLFWHSLCHPRESKETRPKEAWQFDSLDESSWPTSECCPRRFRPKVCLLVFVGMPVDEALLFPKDFEIMMMVACEEYLYQAGFILLWMRFMDAFCCVTGNLGNCVKILEPLVRIFLWNRDVNHAYTEVRSADFCISHRDGNNHDVKRESFIREYGNE
ncbi:Na(+)/H(+) antiporter NhaA [Trichinella pseudospiralis]